MHSFAFVVVLSFSTILAWAAPQPPAPKFTVGQIVRTGSGAVLGQAATRFPAVSEYLGIPYARPPVGNLRFAAPVKYTGSSMLNGTAFGFSCPQLPSSPGIVTPEIIAASNITNVGLELFGLITNPPGVSYNEDCLYLNVWTQPQSGERRKAVMVYMHGGGFTGGTSSMPVYNGASLAHQQDVVIVNFNYRLSILGFPARGNLGLLDQRLAMEWIRDNIANFGGDPARITLFGQSAGAISADYYAYAYVSDPIAAGIILESGTATSFGLPYPADVASVAWYTVTAAVGCGNQSTDSTVLMACMRRVDVNSILRAVSNTGTAALLSAFGPTVDDKLVFSNYSGRIPARVPILIGSNHYEAGSFRTQLALANMTFADSDWDEYNLAGYTCPAGLRANASRAAGIPTWRYRYHAVFPNTNISSQGGAYHGAELTLIFGTTFANPKSTKEENKFESFIQGAWATFAKDPVRGLTVYAGGWPVYDPVKKSLIRLGYDNRVGANPAFAGQYDTGCANISFADLICRLVGQC